MNRIRNIADWLGVEIGEGFAVESEGKRLEGVFKFTESDLKALGHWTSGRWETADEALRLLINGKAKVERLVGDIC